MARAYLGAADARTPLASPLFADLAGLPPLLIQVGSEEVLLDDAVGLAERAKTAGVPATLEIWPDMIHVWHWFFPMLDEGQQAIESAGAFARAKTR
jgi:acetyl esterase/lipase